MLKSSRYLIDIRTDITAKKVTVNRAISQTDVRSVRSAEHIILAHILFQCIYNKTKRIHHYDDLIDFVIVKIPNKINFPNKINNSD